MQPAGTEDSSGTTHADCIRSVYCTSYMLIESTTITAGESCEERSQLWCPGDVRIEFYLIKCTHPRWCNLLQSRGRTLCRRQSLRLSRPPFLGHRPLIHVGPSRKPGLPACAHMSGQSGKNSEKFRKYQNSYHIPNQEHFMYSQIARELLVVF